MSSVAIVASASGDTTIIAAVATHRFYIKKLFLVTKGAVDVQFKSDTTVITGVMGMAANGQINITQVPNSDEALLIGHAINKAFIINLSGAVVVGGFCQYDMKDG